MNQAKYHIKEINLEYKVYILRLVQGLNPNIASDILEKRLMEMLAFENYKCFGLFDDLNEAKKAHDFFQKKFSGFWVRLTELNMLRPKP